MHWQSSPEQFVGDVRQRENAISMSDEERVALRKARMRGASLGKVALASAGQ